MFKDGTFHLSKILMYLLPSTIEISYPLGKFSLSVAHFESGRYLIEHFPVERTQVLLILSYSVGLRQMVDMTNSYIQATTIYCSYSKISCLLPASMKLQKGNLFSFESSTPFMTLKLSSLQHLQVKTIVPKQCFVVYLQFQIEVNFYQHHIA